ncbi:uncharacterized protein LOC141728296 [Zonotrichia albicollis]|uniref:uncharacterized protein LOC141728296 n=1 Tax=Zonotrichia albicollis TaxID=44394 RepID=UPI003D80E076
MAPGTSSPRWMPEPRGNRGSAAPAPGGRTRSRSPALVPHPRSRRGPRRRPPPHTMGTGASLRAATAPRRPLTPQPPRRPQPRPRPRRLPVLRSLAGTSSLRSAGRARREGGGSEWEAAKERRLPPFPPRPPGCRRSSCRRKRLCCLCYASPGCSALLGSPGCSCFAFLLLLPVAVICISPALIEMRLFTPASPRRSPEGGAAAAVSPSLPPVAGPLFHGRCGNAGPAPGSAPGASRALPGPSGTIPAGSPRGTSRPARRLPPPRAAPARETWPIRSCLCPGQSCACRGGHLARVRKAPWEVILANGLITVSSACR